MKFDIELMTVVKLIYFNTIATYAVIFYLAMIIKDTDLKRLTLTITIGIGIIVFGLVRLAAVYSALAIMLTLPLIASIIMYKIVKRYNAVKKELEEKKKQ